MYATIDLTFFNKQTGKATITMQAASVSIQNVLQPIYSSIDLAGEVNSLLKKMMPEAERNFNLAAEIFSPDLDQLKALKAKPATASLAGAVAVAIIEYLLKESGLQIALPDLKTGFAEYCGDNPETAKVREIIKAKINTSAKETNRYLAETLIYLKNHQSKEAENKFKVIDNSSLSDDEKILYQKAKLLLNYSNKRTDLAANQEKFRSVAQRYSYNKTILPGIYLDFIKYAEDLREVKPPKQVLEEFENSFSVTNIGEEEKAYFFYLKGRQCYGRGLFIEALNYLNKAEQIYLSLGMEEELANVYNTATNSFTDNLYFEAAETLANKALNIRQKFNSPLIGETYSLLGGIYFKKADFVQAAEYFKTALEKLSTIYQPHQLNRNYNYLAKAYLFAGEPEESKKYLDIAFKALENATEKEKSYTYLYQLILAYSNRDEKTFLQTAAIFQNPQNYFKFDAFAMGWSYTYLTLFHYNKNEIALGHQFLKEAIDFFTGDSYSLEAGLVWCYNLIHTPDDYQGEPFDEREDLMSKLFEYFETYRDLNKNYFVDLLQNKESTVLKEIENKFLEAARLQNRDEMRELLKEILAMVCLV